ncbi:MAG: hypothetical protein ACR2MD_01015 [Aridibacter sp.]
MAFDITDRIAIIQVLDISLDRLDLHLQLRGYSMTLEQEMAVLSLVDEYNAIPNDGLEIFPTESNFGASIKQNSKSTAIINAIRNILNIYGTYDNATRLVRS